MNCKKSHLEIEKELQQKLEEQTLLLDNVKFHVWFLQDSQTYGAVNQAHAKFLGMEKEELANRNLYDFLETEEAERHVASNKDVFSQKLQIDSEEWIMNGNGGKRLLSISKIPKLDENNEVKYVVCCAEDITELKETREALRESEDKFRTYTEKAPLGIFVADSKGHYVEANRAACQMSGYTKEELLNLTIPDFLAPEFFNTGMTMFEEIKTKGYAESDVMVRKKNKDTFWINLVSVSINNNTIIAFCKDITEAKHAQEKVQYLSFHDGLTGLYNRAYLEQEMQRLDTERQLPIGIIMADSNDLKLVNDTYGHKVGDEMLQSTSEVLRNSCRMEDIIARWGGDEFVIFLPHATQDDANTICERINDMCKATYVKGIPISIALGAAIKNSMQKDLSEVLKEAEDNMYKHKRAKTQPLRDLS